MDAISDISRASQIVSYVPARSPLISPLDLERLLGLTDTKNASDTHKRSFDYQDKHKIFVNHLDSYLGKYILTVSI